MNRFEENPRHDFGRKPHDGSDLPDELVRLLADELVGELSPAERNRLASLINSADDAMLRNIETQRQTLREAADLIGLSTEVSMENQKVKSDRDGGPVPLTELVQKIRNDAEEFFDPEQMRRPKSTLTERRGTIIGMVGWCVAAGLAAIFIANWFRSDGAAGATEQVAAIMPTDPDEFAQRYPDAIQLDWTANDETLLLDQNTVEADFGGLVWDSRSQIGLMRLRGLPVNDPASEQYQLWIIDPERDDEPIDGGVFNVTSDVEAIVPIAAKLDVVDPVGFAITIEQPGGVVVSDQSRLPLLAMVD